MLQIIRKLLKRCYDHFAVIQDHGCENRIDVCADKYRGKLNLRIYGNRNKVSIDPSCVLTRVNMIIYGDNNVIKIDRDAKIQIGNFSLYDGASLYIEHNATFQGVATVLKGCCCKIGCDCMFSDGIKIRNYDGHKIIDQSTGMVINPSGDILIGDHVWVGQDVSILKNTEIRDGAIIGCKALVSGIIEQNCIAVGIPAKVIKRDVTWLRH